MKCPSFERLIEYLDDHLTIAEAERVRAHLASGCQSCAASRQWYENARAIAANDDSIEPPPWVLKRAVRIFDAQRERAGRIERIGSRVASLIFDSLARPAAAGVRSTASANRQLLYRAGDYSIDLQVAASGQSRADLTGQVLRVGEAAFESVAGLPLELAHEGETICSTVTDEIGQFIISGVDFGQYDLRVETPEGRISVTELPVAES